MTDDEYDEHCTKQTEIVARRGRSRMALIDMAERFAAEKAATLPEIERELRELEVERDRLSKRKARLLSRSI